MTIWKTCIYASLSAIVLMLFIIAAKAQEPQPHSRCAPMGQVFKTLKDQYHETMRWASKDSPQAFVITQSESGSWTLLRLAGDGQNVCILAAGSDSKFFIHGLPI